MIFFSTLSHSHIIIRKLVFNCKTNKYLLELYFNYLYYMRLRVYLIKKRYYKHNTIRNKYFHNYHFRIWVVSTRLKMLCNNSKIYRDNDKIFATNKIIDLFYNLRLYVSKSAKCLTCI